MKISDFLRASNAYTSISDIDKIGGIGNDEYKKPEVNIFANLVKSNIQSDFNVLKKADNLAIMASQGASVTGVVTALAEAEQVINKMVTIKQTMLNALNDILKLSF